MLLRRVGAGWRGINAGTILEDHQLRRKSARCGVLPAIVYMLAEHLTPTGLAVLQRHGRGNCWRAGKPIEDEETWDWVLVLALSLRIRPSQDLCDV